MSILIKDLLHVSIPLYALRLQKELKQFMKLDKLTSEMVHRLVDKIEVQADGSVNIHYKFTSTAFLTA
ncbi:DUF4368 domain-containing protein [Paenibacillus xylanivorans]|uniref:DUF4368 domain-containing protein n=1 Tax=Paenibacillus xylanivorans TaxID=1705561 RepID=UPI002E81447E|nr:DUF4368 domain-containing protein [Paenibacillus xylanivorans]